MLLKEINLNKAVEYATYLLIFLLPWQTRWIIFPSEVEYWQVSIYGTEILLLLVGLLFVISTAATRRSGVEKSHTVNISRGEISRQARDDNKKKRVRPIFLIIIIFIILAGASIFWAGDTLAAQNMWVFLLAGVALAVLVQNPALSWKNLSLAFVTGAVIQAGFGILQFILQDTLLVTKWLGLAAHTVAQGGTVVVEVGGERWLRAYAGLPHPNILGGYLALALILLMGFFKKPSQMLLRAPALPRGRQRGNPEIASSSETPRNDKSINLWSIFFYGSLIVLSTGLFFTFSRSAWLAYLVGLFTLLTFVYLQKTHFSKRALGRYFLVLLITVVVAGFVFSSLVFTRVTTGGERLEGISISERLAGLEATRTFLAANWLSGTGAGNFTRALAEQFPDMPAYSLQPVHNIFLLVAAELGVFGLALLIVIFKSVFIATWRKKDFLFFSLLLVILIIGLFDHYLWSLYFGQLLLWFVLGLALRKQA